MTVFSYRAYRGDGTAEIGTIEGVDRSDAMRRLVQANKRPFALIQTGVQNGQHGKPPRLRTAELTKLFGELAVLLNAGFNVPSALRIYASAERSSGRKAILLAISDQISSGKSLAEAFSHLPSIDAGLVVQD